MEIRKGSGKGNRHFVQNQDYTPSLQERGNGHPPEGELSELLEEAFDLMIESLVTALEKGGGR